ncbi:MAG: hypothetical protein ACQESV_06695 [Thermodesulfobacteriota bacterium]
MAKARQTTCVCIFPHLFVRFPLSQDRPAPKWISSLFKSMNLLECQYIETNVLNSLKIEWLTNLHSLSPTYLHVFPSAKAVLSAQSEYIPLQPASRAGRRDTAAVLALGRENTYQPASPRMSPGPLYTG